tara:strand:- start:114 stop:1094 length:981 start_codon:yes stop_codon:yes gene_type:complete
MDNLNNNLPWVEKYRPKNISNIFDQNEITTSLKKTINSNCNIPHYLFYGTPGTGKTTTALVLCYQMFKKESFNERVLELNASDERGIKVVREKIKTFAKLKIKEKENIPNFKVIILDEADALTDESQFALRRIIEVYSKSTRFFFICNYVTKINKAIISRCVVYRFKPLNSKSITKMLKNISKKENVKINNEDLNKIQEISNGDLRKAINTLQRISYFENMNNLDNILFNVSEDSFENIICKIKEVNNYKDLIELTTLFINNSYGGNNILKEFSKNIIKSNKFTNYQKTLLFKKISYFDYLLNTGSNEELIIINLFSHINNVINNY